MRKKDMFTKDDLECLLDFADVYTEFGHSWSTKLHMPLIQKIMHMIENYDDNEDDENAKSDYIDNQT